MLLKQRRGLTSFETLVFVIIVLVTVIFFGANWNRSSEQAKMSSFCRSIANVETAIYQWQVEHITETTGFPTLEELNSMLTNPKYFRSIPLNPYTNKPIVFTATLQNIKGSASYSADYNSFTIRTYPECTK